MHDDYCNLAFAHQLLCLDFLETVERPDLKISCDGVVFPLNIHFIMARSTKLAARFKTKMQVSIFFLLFPQLLLQL